MPSIRLRIFDLHLTPSQYVESLLSRFAMGQVQVWSTSLPTTPVTQVYCWTGGLPGTQGHVMSWLWGPRPSRLLFPPHMDVQDLFGRSNGGDGSKGLASIHIPRDLWAKLICSFAAHPVCRLSSLLLLCFWSPRLTARPVIALDAS